MFKNLLSESILNIFKDIYYGFGEFGSGIFGSSQKNNLIVLNKLKNVMHDKDYFWNYNELKIFIWIVYIN